MVADECRASQLNVDSSEAPGHSDRSSNALILSTPPDTVTEVGSERSAFTRCIETSRGLRSDDDLPAFSDLGRGRVIAITVSEFLAISKLSSKLEVACKLRVERDRREKKIDQI